MNFITLQRISSIFNIVKIETLFGWTVSQSVSNQATLIVIVIVIIIIIIIK